MGNRRLLLCLSAVMLAAIVGCSEPAEDTSPHPTDWVVLHQGRVRTVNYDFTSCGECHGTDLAGGEVAEGCSRESCHSAEEGIYSCDNCHGFTDSDPFKNVAGDTSTDTLTVGVHTSHYTGAHDLTVNVTCNSCHVVPDSVSADGHFYGGSDTTLYAEVPFGYPVTSDSVFLFTWDRTNGTCRNVYCHGSFTYERADSTGIFVTGNNLTMTWTAPIVGNLCGTCHGLPPTGHRPMSGLSCGNCHNTVVSQADHRTIIGPILHINGAKNF